MAQKRKRTSTPASASTTSSSPTSSLTSLTTISRDSTSTPPLQEFGLFLQLPTEIRFKIWDLIEEDYLLALIGCPMSRGACSELFYSRPMPITLRICRDSRDEYLAVKGTSKGHATYQLCHKLSHNHYRGEVDLYANLEVDTVLGAGKRFFQCEDFCDLRYLALFHQHAATNMAKLPGLKSLRTLTIIYPMATPHPDDILFIQGRFPKYEEDGYADTMSRIQLYAGYFIRIDRILFEQALKNLLKKNPSWKIPLIKWSANFSFFDNPHKARLAYEEMESKGEATQERIMEHNTQLALCMP